jgi:hypothetical protein
MTRLPSILLAAALGYSLFSCGGSSPFSSAPESELRTAFAPSLGAPLAAEISAAWKPALADIAKLEAAGSARDFATYHQAMLALRTTYAKGVDETIRILDSSSDQSWRHRLFTESVGGEGGGKTLQDSFPLLSEESDETKAWFRGLMMEHPRESGEMARVIVGLHYDATRLSLYFVTAISAEAAKSVGEAYDGFTKPGQPQTPPR